LGVGAQHKQHKNCQKGMIKAGIRKKKKGELSGRGERPLGKTKKMFEGKPG